MHGIDRRDRPRQRRADPRVGPCAAIANAGPRLLSHAAGRLRDHCAHTALDVAKLLAEPAAKTDAALAKAFVKGPLETSVNASEGEAPS
jgi:hypothetical protein